MKNVTSIIRHRYKIESVLAIFAIVMFGGFIVPQTIMWGWGADPLRTMMFTLFGIVGLMGFSIAVKRHEEDRKRNEQTIEEHKAREEEAQIQRMHACIQQLSNESPFAVFLGALHELETMFKKLNAENKDFLIRILCFFIQTDRIRKHSTNPSPASIAEEDRINFAFKTLRNLSNKKPIKTLKEKRIHESVNLSFMTFKGEDMALEGEDLTGCDFTGTTFVNTSIINCKLNASMQFLSGSGATSEVAIDECDLQNWPDQSSVDSVIDILELMQPVRIYFTEKPPTGLPVSEEDNQRFLNIIHREAEV